MLTALTRKIFLVATLATFNFTITNTLQAQTATSLPVYRINPSIVSTPVASSTLLLNLQDIQNLKAHPARYTNIIQACNNQLNYQPSPVARLNLQPHYTATGANEDDTSAKNLSNDAIIAYRMGFCYLMTNDVRYAVTTQRILDAWATTFDTATTQQGSDNINFNLPSMVIAASWVKAAKLPNGQTWDSHRFDSFLINKVLPLAQLDNDNNHGLWAVLMKASIGAYLGRDHMLDTAQQRWQQILLGMVATDGTLPHELARSDTNNYVGGKTKGIKGIAYTHYALLPASVTAKILSDAGRDVWYTAGGQLLQRAYNRAATLTLHPETSPYYASNQGKLVGVHNASYFPLLLKYFPKPDASKAVSLGYTNSDRFMLATLF